MNSNKKKWSSTFNQILEAYSNN